MSFRKGVTSVHRVSHKISPTIQREVLSEIQASAEKGNQRFVLDCSEIEHVGPSEIRFLLCCLEEVMKHNGDVRLAMLRPEVQSTLRHVGVNRVFEMYDTIEGAILSYQLRFAEAGPSPVGMTDEDQATEYAA